MHICYLKMKKWFLLVHTFTTMQADMVNFMQYESLCFSLFNVVSVILVVEVFQQLQFTSFLKYGYSPWTLKTKNIIII